MQVLTQDKNLVVSRNFILGIFSFSCAAMLLTTKSVGRFKKAIMEFFNRYRTLGRRRRLSNGLEKGIFFKRV